MSDISLIASQQGGIIYKLYKWFTLCCRIDKLLGLLYMCYLYLQIYCTKEKKKSWKKTVTILWCHQSSAVLSLILSLQNIEQEDFFGDGESLPSSSSSSLLGEEDLSWSSDSIKVGNRGTNGLFKVIDRLSYSSFMSSSSGYYPLSWSPFFIL